jgi:outer membrane protein assembly factor BamB
MKARYRYLIDGGVVVVVVAILLTVITIRQSQQMLANSNGGSLPPAEDWRPSQKADDEVSADFSVETDQKNNVKLAGKHPGTDWPQFNGARRDNKSDETGLLKQWPTDGPKLLWICHGLGTGFSTVAVVNGVAYTMGDKGKSEAVIALDCGTGEKIWSTPFANPTQSSPAGPRSTPAVANGAVYALGGNGDLVCLEADSGKIRWHKNISRDFGGHIPGWGICESVLVDQDKVICTPGGQEATIIALDPKTGRVLWQSLTPETDRVGYASPAVAEVGGGRQYVQFTAGGTIGVRADDGRFLWRENTSANGTANCSSPLVAGDFVFTASGYNTGGTLVKLHASQSGVTAEHIYHTPDMKSHHGDMVIVDGFLYGASDPGVLTCIQLATGKTKWRTRSVAKGSITYADGRLYCREEGGRVFLVEANSEAFHERGRLEQPKRASAAAWAHPVVAAGRLFLRDQDKLLCYDVKSAK